MTKVRAHPWRDNLEAIAIALTVAILFKYFIVEAYKIPTGSMQPTLIGWENKREGGGIFDRVLVDKLSYHARDPERFEVIVFHFPLDRSKNFIKRLWGLPGERLRIRGGDVWRQEGEGGAWHILRRPDSVMREGWLELDQEDRWSLPQGWTLEGRELRATGPGSASFPRGTSSVRDHYTDGYPKKLALLIQDQRALPGGTHAVGDLRIRARVRADQACREVRLQLHEGTRTYTATLPGPAAPEEARPRIGTRDSLGRLDLEPVEAPQPERLSPSRPLEVSFENLDDRLRLCWPGGELTLEIPPSNDQHSGLWLETRGGGATFSDLHLYRDIYYTSNRSVRDTFEVPADHYFVLGDNTLDSRDSRAWQRTGFRVSAPPFDGAEVWGSRYQDQARNPTDVVEEGEIWSYFRDEYGELRRFPRRSAAALTPRPASFVPRAYITGRALFVFWPQIPSLDIYRLHWLH